MVRDRRLADVEQRGQLAHAHLACVLAEYVDQLEADGVAERFGDLGDALGLRALHVRVDDRVAARPSGRALALGGEFQIDAHQLISNSYIDIFQCDAPSAMIQRAARPAPPPARSLAMRIAVITDIHGNLPALEAALAAIEVDWCRRDLLRWGSRGLRPTSERGLRTHRRPRDPDDLRQLRLRDRPRSDRLRLRLHHPARPRAGAGVG